MIRRRAILALVALVGMAVLPLVAQQESDRVKAVGGKFLCMCNCNQVLTQCNHVGCMMSATMLKELGEWVRRGDSDTAITQAFVQEYGTTVYAEPPKTGFSMVAWAMPMVYFLVGITLVLFVITKWRRRAPAVPTAALDGQQIPAEVFERARAQAARETED
jgi:cytochrome c-type biogenesis protein CcmH